VNAFSQIDYLVIGHICRDIVPGGYAPGGTALYSALAAQALGCRTAVVTSADSTDDIESLLPGIDVHKVIARESTVFENTYRAGTRIQSVFSEADTIRSVDIPAAWQRTSIVHLGPIIGEIEADVIRLFSNSLVGITPQGWLRKWDDDRRVYSAKWPAANQVIPLASAIITSPEDLPDLEYLDELRRLSQILVLTRGRAGCTVYWRNEERHFAAPEVDVAAAFLIRLHQTNGNPWEAALFANQIASRSVAEDNLSAKIDALREVVRDQM